MNEQAIAFIAALGGSHATARALGLKQPSVTKWKRAGISPDRLLRLQVMGQSHLSIRRALKAAGLPTRPTV